jgi:proline racemase
LRVTLYRRVVHTVDSHTEGNATRVIVGGVPEPPGVSLLDKRAWLMRHDDALRRMVNFEPRGSSMMCSVLLLPTRSPEAHFAAIIMEQDEYVPMCGHCIIGTATTVVATGMVAAVEPATIVRFETPAGLVTCKVAVECGRIGPVSFENVDSFLLLTQAPLVVPGLGEFAVDIAYGGDFYTFVDADALGLDIGPANDAALIAAWSEIRRAVKEQLRIVHPERPDIDTCYQVLFHAVAKRPGEYRQTILCPPGSLDRSPCGTGTSARVALLHTRGEIGLGEPRRFEGVLGTAFTGEAVKAVKRGTTLFVTPRITGRAYITGYHQFVLEPEDPLPEGYRIGRTPRRMDESAGEIR